MVTPYLVEPHLPAFAGGDVRADGHAQHCVDVLRRLAALETRVHVPASLTVGKPAHTIRPSMRSLVIFVASAGYVGYMPVASGTFGSLVGIPLFWGFDALRGASAIAYLLAYVGLVAAACWVAGKAEKYFNEHDSHKIVIDEVAGYVAATLFLTPTWTHALLAFFIFRAFDVLKPFPAGYIDANFPGGYGVVLDDVVSGLYSNVAVQLLIGIGLVT